MNEACDKCVRDSTEVISGVDNGFPTKLDTWRSFRPQLPRGAMEREREKKLSFFCPQKEASVAFCRHRRNAQFIIPPV